MPPCVARMASPGVEKGCESPGFRSGAWRCGILPREPGPFSDKDKRSVSSGDRTLSQPGRFAEVSALWQRFPTTKDLQGRIPRRSFCIYMPLQHAGVNEGHRPRAPLPHRTRRARRACGPSAAEGKNPPQGTICLSGKTTAPGWRAGSRRSVRSSPTACP